jgi:hypothetical protein
MDAASHFRSGPVRHATMASTVSQGNGRKNRRVVTFVCDGTTAQNSRVINCHSVRFETFTERECYKSSRAISRVNVKLKANVSEDYLCLQHLSP